MDCDTNRQCVACVRVSDFGALCVCNTGISRFRACRKLRKGQLIFHSTPNPSVTMTSSENNNDNNYGTSADSPVNWAEVQLPSPIRRSAATSVPTQTRPCATCSQQFPWDGLAYKTVCDTCYRTKTRSCAVCHVGTIRASAPDFHKVCTSCYVDTKRIKCYSPCPTCPPERSHHLRRPPGRDHCPECDAIFASRAKIGR